MTLGVCLANGRVGNQFNDLSLVGGKLKGDKVIRWDVGVHCEELNMYYVYMIEEMILALL